MNRDLLKLSDFDPFSDDYVADVKPLEPFSDGDVTINHSVIKLPAQTNEQSSRLKHLMEFTFNLERCLDVPGKRHGLTNGVPWRQVNVANTPEQFQQLLEIEMGAMDIKDRKLFIGEVINKYMSKVELFDKELTPDERVTFFEYKQEFMMFINWLKKETEDPQKRQDSTGQNALPEPKRLTDVMQVAGTTENKQKCLNECLNVLKDMKVVNDVFEYIPKSKKKIFAFWLHTLNEFCIIDLENLNKAKMAELLKSQFDRLNISESSLQKEKIGNPFKDVAEFDGYKQEIKTIAISYACIKER